MKPNTVKNLVISVWTLGRPALPLPSARMTCRAQEMHHIILYMKSSDAKASKRHLKFSSKMTIFIKLVYLSTVISLK